MMIFLLTLTFPRETAGATFFYQYDQSGNHTLNCSQSATKSVTKYIWCRGQDSSLQQFELIGGDQKRTLCGSESSCLEKILDTCAFSADGIFARTLWAKDRRCPLFSNNSHCSESDFFIVAVRNSTEEEKVFGAIREQSEPAVVVPEKDNFTLTCEFRIDNSSTIFSLYWIKEATPSRCLFSASNEEEHSRNVSYDFNCCADAAVKERRTHHSDFHGQLLQHNLTLSNASSSDSGVYLCVVAAWARKRVWTIARNVSVEVNGTMSHNRTSDVGNSSSFIDALPIPLAGIGGVILICGIIGLVYWKKKAKGNPAEERPRNQAEMKMEEDDCSPYAISSRNTIDRNETMYSVVMYPPEPQQGVSTVSDGKLASQSGKEVHTVYALVSK